MNLELLLGAFSANAEAGVRRDTSLKHTHHIAHGRAVKGLTMFNPLAVAQVPSCPPEQYTHHTGHQALKNAKTDHFACVSTCVLPGVSNERQNQAVDTKSVEFSLCVRSGMGVDIYDARGKRQYRFKHSHAPP